MLHNFGSNKHVQFRFLQLVFKADILALYQGST